MSYLFNAFLPTPEIPSAQDAKEYLIEGALFNERPRITIAEPPEHGFVEMSLFYDPAKRPMILRRIFGEDEESARSDAAAEASAPECESIEKTIQTAPVVLEWEVERSEMDKDAWMALHLWQAWILSPSKGLLYAPDEGVFDSDLRLLCSQSAKR